ncbi:putative ribonuclease H1, partial [Ilyonectria destructans]
SSESIYTIDFQLWAQGATTWSRDWVLNGWKTSSGAEVKNGDLWKLLLGEIERRNRSGLKIQFWKIPRSSNVTADRAAKQAAEKDEELDQYCEIKGILT